MDKFELWLLKEIESGNKALQNPIEWLNPAIEAERDANIRALEAYRKHKQDAPAFRVGDRVCYVHNRMDKSEWIGTVTEIRFKVYFDNQSVQYSLLPYRADELEPIEDEESEEQQS